jgi:hypothetical protein
MPSDPGKPLVGLDVAPDGARRPGRQFPGTRATRRSPSEQGQRFGSAFQRLADVLARDPAGLELRADPAAMAPERLLVFEVAGPIQNFSAAVRRIEGLQLVDEEELEAADRDSRPVAYLLVPDVRALTQLLSLWRDWQAERPLATGYTPWRDVFALLRDLRPWGPGDRVVEEDQTAIAEEAATLGDADMVRVEIERVFRASATASDQAESTLLDSVRAASGLVVDRSRIDSIAYHAILAHLPAGVVRSIVALVPSSIAGLDAVMHVRPQAVSFSIETKGHRLRAGRCDLERRLIVAPGNLVEQWPVELGEKFDICSRELTRDPIEASLPKIILPTQPSLTEGRRHLVGRGANHLPARLDSFLT